jgi:hypothetical protein
MSTHVQPTTFRFKSTDNIGAAAAEDDAEFLKTCFVDTGALKILEDLEDRRLIVLGRTGAGKSALMTTLAERQPGRVIQISPEHLALTYVANSTILNFFGSLGVNLDPFFKLLWRHVLTVEVLTHHFHQTQESRPLLDRLRELFLGPSKHDKDMRQAIQYLDDWGKSFWQDTEFRVREITNMLESKLDAEAKATLGTKAATLSAGAKSTERITETEKAELISRGQDIISKAQVQDLHKVLGLVDAVLLDKQRRYYLIVDGLDENWVEERLRYKLIVALMQTARDFSEVRHAKIIVAIRRDLIERVFRLTRDSGFQEEKYQSLYLPLVWNKRHIIDILDKRIDHLIARRYSGSTTVTHRDVLPKVFKGLRIDDYIYQVARRPRDVIAFFNTCIGSGTRHAKIGGGELRLAEGEYSRGRLRALADEWSMDHSSLIEFAAILQRRPPSFKVALLTDADVEDVCLTVAANDPGGIGLAQAAMQVVDGPMSLRAFKLLLVRTFYQVGLVGLKVAPHETESWSDEFGRSVSFPEINDHTSIVVHPAYYRALGIRQ